jgi:predicted Zn-dependent protease with MMP-like domain
MGKCQNQPELPPLAAVEQMVEQALAAVPEQLHRHLTNLAVVIEDWPDEGDDLADEEGEMLGMLDGPALTERSLHDPYSYPTRLVLFRGPIADEAAELDGDVGLVVRETVWHELAHFFGYDEDGAYAMETKWEDNWRRKTQTNA